MQHFANSPRPIESMWGHVQTAEELIPGIWIVSTASHGGMILSDERQTAMPDALRLDSTNYEEECNWCLPVMAFEAEFAGSTIGKPSFLQLARDTARCWHPDRYTAFTGEEVPENKSHVLKERAAYTALIGRCVATSAWGDWAEWVPEGQIGFIVREIAAVDHLGHANYTAEERWGLANKADWDACTSPRPLASLNATIIDRPARV